MAPAPAAERAEDFGGERCSPPAIQASPFPRDASGWSAAAVAGAGRLHHTLGMAAPLLCPSLLSYEQQKELKFAAWELKTKKNPT